MATWVEDIVQALKNLGERATLNQIYDEVKRIRTEPLPVTYKATIRERIESHSSDSNNFKGKDLFRKVDKGVWALRELGAEGYDQPTHWSQNSPSNDMIFSNRKDEAMATWTENVIQALNNLGGQATLTQIYDEVRRICKSPLPKRWQHIIQDTIYQHSSDTQKFQGNDLFQKAGKGIWALRGYAGQTVPVKVVSAHQRRQDSFQNFLPPESLDEISTILSTIKQYRDYQNPGGTTWTKYIKEFFYILGFSTEEINPRLYTLDIMGSNHTPEAVLVVVHPGENFDEVVPGLPWDSYCFLAAQYYQVRWRILTNGIQLKVINDNEAEEFEPMYWQDIDQVICKEQIDTFCSIYKVFSYVKAQKGRKPGTQTKGAERSRHLAERHLLRLKFWQQLLEKAKGKTTLHAKISPGVDNWISTGAGKGGLGYSYVVRMDNAQVELYIDRGDRDWNKRVFNALYQQRTEIENRFGGPLDWQLLPDKRACRICYVITGYGLKDQDHWDELQDQMIEAMIRFEKALRAFIRQL